MKSSKYELFIKILEAGTFSDAAEKLNYTQSGISQVVQALESELGVTLLHRSKKGLSLTAEGERLLPLFQDIYNAELRLHNELLHTTNDLTGTIRLGTIPSISCHFLPQVIRRFKDRYPKVEYQILHGNYRDVEHLIMNGRVDLGFIRTPSPYQLDMIPFPPEPLFVILPVNHPLTKHDTLTPKDLDQIDFILQDDGYSKDILHYLEKHNTHPKITQVIKGNISLFGFVGNGLGVSLVPGSMVPLLPSGICFKTVDPPPRRTIAIACKNRTKLSTVNKLFMNEIIAFREIVDEQLLSDCTEGRKI